LAWWNGLLPSLVLVSNPAVNFVVYEALKRNVLPILAVWVRSLIATHFIAGISKLAVVLLFILALETL